MAGISSKAAGGMENHKKFVGQEFDEDFDVDLYEFKWRHHDPQIGRFIEVDPLADKYVYNTTYAYAENRVINGIDLEGLEFVEKISNKNHTKQWEITLKAVNLSTDTKENFEEQVNSTKSAIESTLQGTDAQGYAVTTTVNIEMKEQSEVNYKNDLVLEVNNGVLRDGRTLVKDNVLGATAFNQTTNGIIEVSSIQALQATLPAVAHEKIVTVIGNAGTHEVGHAGGNDHSDDPKSSSYEKDAPKDNFMRMQAQTGAATSTPSQLLKISDTIKIKINVDK
jgi:RHS repeat-associated protein